MKKAFCLTILFILFSFTQSLFAVVLESELEMSNFALKRDGSYRKVPDFGGKFSIEEQIYRNFNLKLSFERDSELGNRVIGIFSYTGSIIEISLGPSLAFLNSSPILSDTLSSFQPGIDVGMRVATNNGFIFGFCGDFALNALNVSHSLVFLHSAGITLGYRFPNLLAELRLSHKGKGIVLDMGKSVFSITDYGLYTEAFSKASRFRIPVNIIFRNIRYTSSDAYRSKKNYGNLLFEVGLKYALNSDVELGALLGVALYSFDVGNGFSGINRFFFRNKYGVRIAL